MGKGSGGSTRPAMVVPVRDGVRAAATWRAARSSGPGGQHANKTSSKVVASVEIDEIGLDEERTDRLRSRLGERVSAVSQDARSQHLNRQQALDRLVEKIERGLHVDPPRTATRPSRAALERAKDAKRLRSVKKQARRWTAE